MAGALSVDHYSDLCQRRRGGGAEHCVEDVELNRFYPIKPEDRGLLPQHFANLDGD
jgi:hypothetical protein